MTASMASQMEAGETSEPLNAGGKTTALAPLFLRGAVAAAVDAAVGAVLLAGIVVLYLATATGEGYGTFEWNVTAADLITTRNVWSGLVIPAAIVMAGWVGAFVRRRHLVGCWTRNPRYIARFVVCVAVMAAGDVIVRWRMGGDATMVFANWASLIAGASAINLAVLDLPCSATRFLDNTRVQKFRPESIAILIFWEVGQAISSSLGARWAVIGVQLLVRRLVLAATVNAVAWCTYGVSGAPRKLRANETVEYMAVATVANHTGQVVEPAVLDQIAVGKALLALPLWCGESMMAGAKTLTRVGDKVLFAEQIMAFSSPTFVTSQYIGVGQVSFIWYLLKQNGDPAGINPLLRDRDTCKAAVRRAMQR